MEVRQLAYMLDLIFHYPKAESTLYMRTQSAGDSGSQDANHWHILWECQVISHFWSEMHKTLEDIFDTKIPFQFCNLILGKVDFRLGRLNEYLFGVLTSACKKTIPRHWLLPAPLYLDPDLVNGIYTMEKNLLFTSLTNGQI